MIGTLFSIVRARKDRERLITVMTEFAQEKSVEKLGLPLLQFQILSGIAAFILGVFAAFFLYATVAWSLWFIPLVGIFGGPVYLLLRLFRSVTRRYEDAKTAAIRLAADASNRVFSTPATDTAAPDSNP